jgi:hypothetical protein
MVAKCREKMRLDDKLLNLESLFRELLENSFHVNYLNYWFRKSFIELLELLLHLIYFPLCISSQKIRLGKAHTNFQRSQNVLVSIWKMGFNRNMGLAEARSVLSGPPAWTRCIFFPRPSSSFTNAQQGAHIRRANGTHHAHDDDATIHQWSIFPSQQSSATRRDRPMLSTKKLTFSISHLPSQGMFGYSNPEGNWRGLNLLLVKNN